MTSNEDKAALSEMIKKAAFEAFQREKSYVKSEIIDVCVTENGRTMRINTGKISERSFCAELYHQLRSSANINSLLGNKHEDIVITSEMGKTITSLEHFPCMHGYKIEQITPLNNGNQDYIANFNSAHFRPDLLIHEPLSDVYNICIIEVKTKDSRNLHYEILDDIKKIHCFKEDLRYEIGLIILVDLKPDDICEKIKVTAEEFGVELMYIHEEV